MKSLTNSNLKHYEFQIEQAFENGILVTFIKKRIPIPKKILEKKGGYTTERVAAEWKEYPNKGREGTYRRVSVWKEVKKFTNEKKEEYVLNEEAFKKAFPGTESGCRKEVFINRTSYIEVKIVEFGLAPYQARFKQINEMLKWLVADMYNYYEL